MTPEEILKKKLDRLETIPNEFADKVSIAQKKIFDKIQKSLKKLTTNNGSIELTQENFAEINNIISEYTNAIKGSGYYNDLKKFVDEFGEQKKMNDTFLKKTLDGFEPDKRTGLIYKQGQLQANQVLGDNTVKSTSDIINSMINSSIVNGDNILDLTSNLSIAIQGNSEIDGALVKSAKLNARDIYATSERGYTTAISKEFGIQFYQYLGGKMDTTRCFCKQRAGNIYHIEEIKAWGRKEDLASCNTGQGWAGMAKGTNENTIMSVAGGYNCGHSFTPKGIKDVPINVIKRAIEKGYIKIDDLPTSLKDRLS